MTSKIILALDFNTQDEVMTLINKINPSLCALKVGLQLFTALGPTFVEHLITKGYKVFLDLKFHDIPNTVAKACMNAAKMGVWMINVHASGGLSMMQAAREAVDCASSNPLNRPLLIAVTLLTSLNQKDIQAIGISDEINTQAGRLAALTKEAGLDGVVCSAKEVPIIKSLCGRDFLTVTPGIRLENEARQDQARVVTPQQAFDLGSDFIVLGRTISSASNPETLLHKLI